jgi:hypothetical protein
MPRANLPVENLEKQIDVKRVNDVDTRFEKTSHDEKTSNNFHPNIGLYFLASSIFNRCCCLPPLLSHASSPQQRTPMAPNLRQLPSLALSDVDDNDDQRIRLAILGCGMV